MCANQSRPAFGGGSREEDQCNGDGPTAARPASQLTSQPSNQASNNDSSAAAAPPRVCLSVLVCLPACLPSVSRLVWFCLSSISLSVAVYVCSGIRSRAQTVGGKWMTLDGRVSACLPRCPPPPPHVLLLLHLFHGSSFSGPTSPAAVTAAGAAITSVSSIVAPGPVGGLCCCLLLLLVVLWWWWCCCLRVQPGLPGPYLLHGPAVGVRRQPQHSVQPQTQPPRGSTSSTSQPGTGPP